MCDSEAIAKIQVSLAYFPMIFLVCVTLCSCNQYSSFILMSPSTIAYASETIQQHTLLQINMDISHNFNSYGHIWHFHTTDYITIGFAYF